MRKISRILLMLILSVFILGYTASAQMDLNVQYDENTKIASISGTIEEKYAGSVAGLYIVAKDALFPDFSSGEYTDIFISLQNSIVGENGSFSFNDVDLSEVEGDIDFNVSILSDATGEIKAHSIYIPTREAIQNFLDKLASAQSGDDVLTLINANIENTLVDGKNVNIGLKGDIYVTYPELNKQTVADMIFASLDGTEISSAAEFKELQDK